MSRQKLDRGERGERPSGLQRSIGRQSARGGERYKQASRGFRSFVLHIVKLPPPRFSIPKFAILFALAFVGWGAELSRAQVSDAEQASYADALAYCRGDVPRPMALRSDKRVLCLDGRIQQVSDILLASGLEEGGLFVVRSHDGDIASTIALADMLLTREAIVVVNDYCLAVCANYFFVASLKTFVPKGALVAWINDPTGPDYCFGFHETRDHGAPRFQAKPCDFPFVGGSTQELIRLRSYFRTVRMLSFEEPPESIAVRRILKRRFDATGKYPDDVYWTWNPRYYAGSMRTRVLYEAYPQSQDEVDANLARLGLGLSVIYDP
jgi:hypothetical protein